MEKGLSDFLPMKRLILSSAQSKRNLFSAVAARTGLQPVIIEKDWWVTQILRAVYSLSYAQHIQFKGGTSLSKCWKLISRFSEDVDLAINRDFLGFSGELSKNQISDKLRRAAKFFSSTTFTEDIKQFFSEVLASDTELLFSTNDSGIPTQDPFQILIEYKTVFPSDRYVAPVVKLEVSGRSNNSFIGAGEVQSLAEQNLQENSPFRMPPCSVSCVLPERTLAEKICLLHEEFNKSKGVVRTDRMSRHLYDIHMMRASGLGKTILNDETFIQGITAHRFKFNRLDGMDYNTERPGGFNIIPPKDVIELYEEDYKMMREKMIYGKEKPEFNEILHSIETLNSELNTMHWKNTPVYTSGGKAKEKTEQVSL